MTDGRRIASRGRLVVALFAIVLIVLGSGMVGCIAGTQQRELMTSTKSPDGRWNVRVFYVNPGASASAFVVVEATSADGGTATLIATLGPDELERATWANDEDLSLEWLSDSELSVGGFPAGMPTP